jgi:hypothetical protein
MSSPSQIAYLCLWCAHPVLQALLAGMMWHRKLDKQFPAFFSYVVCQIAIFAITFPLWRSGNYEWFFWAYWTGAAVNAILGLKVIHEIFLDVFRQYHSLKDLGTIVFRWAGTVMLMVSAVVAFSNSPNYSPIVHAVTTLQRSVRFVQFGLVIFLLLFSRYLGISRRQYSFGIALGFGFFASIELVLLALNSGGFLHKDSFALVNMTTYIAAILAWVRYTFLPNPAQTVPANHFQTERWEESLADLQHPANSDSLIPMFEGMVERALSRSSNVANMPPQENAMKPPGSLASPRSIAATAGAGGRTRK